MRTFKPNEFKKAIKKEFGSVAKLKSYLRTEAEDLGWDCRLAEVVIDGVKVKYTSNPNHFARYFVELPHVGFTSTTALDRSSYTAAGKRRHVGSLRTVL